MENKIPLELSIDLPQSIEVIPGRLTQGDFVVLFHGYAITLIEHLAIGVLISRNEENRYPQTRGLMGRRYYQELYNYCIDNLDITPQALKQRGLKWN